jgi:hypothetical protein
MVSPWLDNSQPASAVATPEVTGSVSINDNGNKKDLPESPRRRRGRPLAGLPVETPHGFTPPVLFD